MSNPIFPKLECTKDYDIFEPHEYNRDIKRTELLKKSMRKYGFDPGFPIRCIKAKRGKLKVTHGHHRLHVASLLGIQVWYIVAPRDIDLFFTEGSVRPWSVEDFTVSRARAGEEPAEAVLQYRDKTGIPLGVAISLVGGEGANSGNKSVDMKRGSFSIGDMKHAHDVEKIVSYCASVGISFAKSTYFVKAISKCLFTNEFDPELFMRKVGSHSKIMEPRRNVDGYLELVDLVYNRQSKEKVPLAFLANQASAQRSCVKAKGQKK